MGQDKFSDRLLRWFDQHGRHDLPWQKNKTLYRVWVSEIMLQQTQVATVIPYYQRFMQRFNSLGSLAETTQDEVLSLWTGLGYYARGRNLHKAAIEIMQNHAGIFPQTITAVNALPGIGRSTAGAILALALDQRHAILDGNVKRSLCRYHGIEGFSGTREIEARLWDLSEQHTPEDRAADYTQAIMDMGATLCTRSKPRCHECPHQVDCVAYQCNRVDQLPTPRPRKNRPSKHRCVLVLINESQEAIVFKRPSSGIWGGLYSFPEFDDHQACVESLRSNLNLSETDIHQGSDIQHSFTHFDLSLTPVYAQIQPDVLPKLVDGLAEHPNTGVILNMDMLSKISLPLSDPSVGLPAPALTILKQIPKSITR